MLARAPDIELVPHEYKAEKYIFEEQNVIGELFTESSVN
jgi:hypothetical protein